jgi:hypothetical protein
MPSHSILQVARAWLLPNHLTMWHGYFDVILWFLELMGFISCMVPLVHNMMLLTELLEDRVNVWDFKKSYVKWSKVEVPSAVIVLFLLLIHGSYLFAALHGMYVVFLLYSYANGEITEVDPTEIMMPKKQDAMNVYITYRMVYYIFWAFVIFFCLIYFTAQAFLRHPENLQDLTKIFNNMFPAFIREHPVYNNRL